MQPGDAVALADDDGSSGWHFLTQVAFRFCVVYFGLFCLLYAEIMFVFTGVFRWWLPDGAIWWQMSTLAPVTEWVGRHVFGVDAVLRPDSRSGDQTAMWVFMFNLLVVTIAATVLWSVLDRRRTHYRRLYAWFAVFIRMCWADRCSTTGRSKSFPCRCPPHR